MFTGLVEKLANVVALETIGAGRRLTIFEPTFQPEIGESIAVNGVCLTVVSTHEGQLSFEIGPETLKRSNLGQLKAGDRVNLERSLRVGDRLGGHFVQGHVDGIGVIESRTRNGDWEDVWFRCPAVLTRLMVPKGSIAIDGVSLTLVNVEAERFSVMLIPHTQAVTTLGFKQVGEPVNLECDMLAKHVQKLMGLNQPLE